MLSSLKQLLHFEKMLLQKLGAGRFEVVFCPGSLTKKLFA
jgi:hypothetical protein